MNNNIRHTTRRLFVPLTPVEIAEAKDDIVKLLEQREEHNAKIAQLAESTKIQKAHIVTIDESLSDKTSKLKHGVLTDVPCKMVINWDMKNVTVYRKDTFEVVEDRSLNEYDRPELTDETDEKEQVSQEQGN